MFGIHPDDPAVARYVPSPSQQGADEDDKSSDSPKYLTEFCLANAINDSPTIVMRACATMKMPRHLYLSAKRANSTALAI